MNPVLRRMLRRAAARMAARIPASDPASGPPRRALAIVHGGIGDRLMTLPALRALRERHPESHIGVIWCGGALPVERVWQEEHSLRAADAIGQLGVMRRGWDFVFVNSIGVHGLATECALALSGIRRRLGPRNRDSRGTVYTENYEIDPSRHVTLTNLAALGIAPSRPAAYPARIARRERRISRAGLPVLIHAGCRHACPGYEINRWPLDRYFVLAERVRAECAREVRFLIGPDEARDLAPAVAARGLPAVAPRSLAELFDAVAASALLVGNDSGPAHIAASVGTPAVVLFGPSNPRRSAPVSDRARYVCAGHATPFDYDLLPEHRALPMERIEIETVREVVRGVLA